MEVNLSEDAILVSVQKMKKSMVTVLENVPEDRIDKLLSTCRLKFGCGGSVVKDTKKSAIVLQGDHKYNIEKAKKTIFEGMDVKIKDS